MAWLGRREEAGRWEGKLMRKDDTLAQSEQDIAHVFAQYYRSLFSKRTPSDEEDIMAFLAEL